MFEVICLIIGGILLIIGFTAPSTVALIAGIIFLALGGVWFIFIGDFDGGDWF